jgi:hypothetical protein
MKQGAIRVIASAIISLPRGGRSGFADGFLRTFPGIFFSQSNTIIPKPLS